VAEVSQPFLLAFLKFWHRHIQGPSPSKTVTPKANRQHVGNLAQPTSDFSDGPSPTGKKRRCAPLSLTPTKKSKGSAKDIVVIDWCICVWCFERFVGWQICEVLWTVSCSYSFPWPLALDVCLISTLNDIHFHYRISDGISVWFVADTTHLGVSIGPLAGLGHGVKFKTRIINRLITRGVLITGSHVHGHHWNPSAISLICQSLLVLNRQRLIYFQLALGFTLAIGFWFPFLVIGTFKFALTEVRERASAKFHYNSSMPLCDAS